MKGNLKIGMEMLKSIETKKDNFPITLLQLKPKKMASYLNHTATTNYLCCVPTLEDSQELVV